MIFKSHAKFHKLGFQKCFLLWQTDKEICWSIDARGSEKPIHREDFEAGISLLGEPRIWL